MDPMDQPHSFTQAHTEDMAGAGHGPEMQVMMISSMISSVIQYDIQYDIYSMIQCDI